MEKFTRHVGFWICLIVAFGVVMATPCFAKKKDKEETSETETKKWAPPGLQRQGKVPPGLEKRGGLPPGQAKKYGIEEKTEKKDAEKESKDKKPESPRVDSPEKERRGPFGWWGKRRTPEEQAKSTKEGTATKTNKLESVTTTPAPKETTTTPEKKPEQEKVTPTAPQRRGPFGRPDGPRNPQEKARIEKEAKEKAAKQ